MGKTASVNLALYQAGGDVLDICGQFGLRRSLSALLFTVNARSCPIAKNLALDRLCCSSEQNPFVSFTKTAVQANQHRNCDGDKNQEPMKQAVDVLRNYRW